MVCVGLPGAWPDVRSARELVAQHIGILRARFRIVVDVDDVGSALAVDGHKAVDPVQRLRCACEIERVATGATDEVDNGRSEGRTGSGGRLDVKRIAGLTTLNRQAGKIVVVERDGRARLA